MWSTALHAGSMTISLHDSEMCRSMWMMTHLQWTLSIARCCYPVSCITIPSGYGYLTYDATLII